MTTLAALPAFEADAKALEAARIATLAWGKAADKADGLSATMGAAIKAAWPLREQANSATVRGWLVEAATVSKGAEWGKIYNAPAPAKEQIKGSAWKQAHNLIDTRVSRAFEAAYPVVPTAPVEPTLTPDQVAAKAASEAAKIAQLEWVQAANEVGQIKAEAAIKAAEVKVTETKAKAAEAKAKIDPTKAAEAEALRAQAEAEKAEADNIKAQAAEMEEVSKIKAETSKALQKAAEEKAAAIRLANKIAKVIEKAEALLIEAGALEGAEGLVDYMTATRNALIEFKAANI
jgi:hypothetical protein